MLATNSDASDAEAIGVLRRMEALEPEGRVLRFTIALRAQLEDDEPISTTFAGLGAACGL